MFIKNEKLIDLKSHIIEIPTTFRIFSEDEIAVYQYYPTKLGSNTFIRRKPKILAKDEINKTNLHANGIIYSVDIHWKPTK